MVEQTPENSQINEWVQALESSDGATRMKATEALAKLDTVAVIPGLLRALVDER